MHQGLIGVWSCKAELDTAGVDMGWIRSSTRMGNFYPIILDQTLISYRFGVGRLSSVKIGLVTTAAEMI